MGSEIEVGVWVGGGVRSRAVRLGVGFEWDGVWEEVGYKKQRWDDSLGWR